MHERHLNRKQYFDEQSRTTERYVVPFIAEVLPIREGLEVLEIGCGHGGNLKPFLDAGCRVMGVDLLGDQLDFAAGVYREHPHRENLRLRRADIYQIDDGELPRFDLIVMKDVIEHIHNQERFMGYVKRFLKPGARMFIAFPPWQMPFGGHQQVCESRVLSRLPYYHLLPIPLYRLLLTRFGEKESRVRELLEVKTTGLSIERFRKVVRNENYVVEKEEQFLINPNYEIKFNLRPRRQSPALASIPYLRNFVTTCCYYLLRSPSP